MDEGILAGDSGFIEKAEMRLNEYVESSSILVLATHSGDLLETICNITRELLATQDCMKWCQPRSRFL